MASTARESRRRKIVDRGSNRLALITGHIHALPSEPSDKPSQPLNSSEPSDKPSQPLNSSEPSDKPSQPLNSSEPSYKPSQPLNSEDPLSHLSDQITDGGSDSTLSNHEGATVAGGHGGSTVEPSSRGFEAGPKASIAPPAETSIKAESPLATSRTMQSLEPRPQISSFVTPNEITSAIAASEKSRLRCSVVLALLVVLSHLRFPLLGSNFIRSIISFRPLYLLLLTNATLVLVPLLFNNQRGFRRHVGAENENPSSGGSDWTEQAGNALEVALVIWKAAEAAFMDCSMYAIIVICGLSLV